MRWLVIAFSMFVSVAIVSVPASADRKGSPSAQAKAQQKVQKAEAKKVRTAAKAQLKQNLADAKATLKASNADLKAQKAALKRAERDSQQLTKANDKANADLRAAERAMRASPNDPNVLANFQAASTNAQVSRNALVAALAAAKDLGIRVRNKQQDVRADANSVKRAKLSVKWGPPSVGQPVFSRNGVLQIKAVDYDAYAVAPALGQLVIGRAPASGPVAPAEPPLPKNLTEVSPAPASGPVAPPEPPSPSSGAAPKPPPEPPLSRAALTVARAESPYQIIPIAVFKQSAVGQ